MGEVITYPFKIMPMKTYVRYVIVFLLVLPLTILGQIETGNRIPLPAGTAQPLFNPVMTKTTTCGTDTIVYPYLKELTFTAPADSFFVDAMVGNVRTASQAYHIAEPIAIHGVQFWGGAYSVSPSPQTLAVRLYLYAVDAMNMPTTKLDSADVTVTNTYGFYEAAFATPHVYGQNFAVAARSIPNDTLTVITNNAGNVWSSNYGESLAWRRFGSGVWNSTVSFFGQDLEYMIFPIVSYDISSSFTASGPSACSGSEAVFTNTSSSLLSNRMLNLAAFDAYWGFAAADSTFAWNYGDGSAEDNALQGAHTYTTAGSYTVSLTADLTGYYMSCSDTYTTAVAVLETPVAGLNLTGTVEFCENGTVSLQAVPATGVAYAWLLDGSLVSDSTGGSFIVSDGGAYSVIVDNACGTDTSEIVTAVVSTVPVAGLQTTGTVELCDGEQADLQAIAASGVDYQWLMDGSPVTDSTFASYLTTEGGDYAVIFSNTCGADTSEAVTVTVNTEPVASLNVSGALTFCEGGSATLDAVPSSGVSYTWLMNNAVLADSTASSIVVTLSGDYTVIASNGCGLDTAGLVSVNVHDLPQQPVILQSGSVLEVDPLTVAPGVLFQWQEGGSDIPDGTTDTLVPPANGSYTVIVTDANGCSNTSEAFLVDNVGIADQAAFFFSVSPNPASTAFTVTYTGELVFDLYDAQGKRVGLQPQMQNAHTLLFAVGTLSDGVYLLRASGGDRTIVERIVVKN
jgi:hypothetical protein